MTGCHYNNDILSLLLFSGMGDETKTGKKCRKKCRKEEVMPTERFYRLSDEKKMAIRDAAIQEFTRVPFEKASINQIIQNAEISRGSFYTYFEGKRDVLSFIFQDMEERIRNYCFQTLEKSKGDFWDMMKKLLDYMLHYFEQHHVFQLARNTMVFQEDYNLFCKPDDTKGIELYHAVDKSGWKSQEMDDFLCVMDMSVANLLVCVTRYFRNACSEEDVRCDFYRRMEFLQSGVCKDQER